MNELILKDKQQTALDAMTEFGLHRTVNGIKKHFLVLKGYAGTGKTFTVNLAAKALGSKVVGMTAPTHKAVKVMKKNAMKSETDHLFNFSTIHSLLGLTPKIQKDGSRKYLRDKKRDVKSLKIHEIEVLFIDEASMINVSLINQLFEYYKEFRQNKPLQLIFLGDPCQIPPVKELLSIVFDDVFLNRYQAHVMELTEIVRQKEGNTILDYATSIRQNLTTQVHSRPDIQHTESESGLCTLPEANLDEILRKLFTNPAYDEDPDLAKVLCWRNKTVKHYNDKIRSMRLGIDNPAKIVVGDLLVCDQPVILDSIVGPQIVYHTSDELTVLAVTENSMEYTYDRYIKNAGGNNVPTPVTETLKTYNATVVAKNLDGSKEEHVITIIHEDSELKFTTIEQELANGAKLTGWGRLWGKFFSFREGFAHVSYNYAITSHKSQGSTYRDTIMVETDINANPKVEERNRIKYVATTRASNKLYIV